MDPIFQTVIRPAAAVSASSLAMTLAWLIGAQVQSADYTLSFGSDAGAPSIEGVFLKFLDHHRTYGNCGRLLATCVRDELVITLQEAIRKLISWPADMRSLQDRGGLKAGNMAGVVVFDPATIQDHATFARPAQYATGMIDVIVNGQLALEDGEPISARPGRVGHGRAWTGQPGGSCKASSQAWSWSP